MARIDFELLNRTADLIKNQGWKGLGMAAFGSALLAVVFDVIALVDSLFAIPILFFQALADVGGTFIRTLFLVPLGIVDAGGQTAIGAFTSGISSLLGPLAFPAAMATAFAGLWVMSKGMDRLDWDVPGLDVPGISLFGNDDEED